MEPAKSFTSNIVAILIFCSILCASGQNGSLETAPNGQVTPRTEVKREPAFHSLQVYPVEAMDPIVTKNTLQYELSAWAELSLSNILFSQFPNLRLPLSGINGKHLIFVPTVGAVIKFTSQISAYICEMQRMQHRVDSNIAEAQQDLGDDASILTNSLREIANAPGNHSAMNSTATLELGEWVNKLNRTVEELITALFAFNATRPYIERILKAHIVKGEWPEPILASHSNRQVTSLSGDSLDTSSYPKRIKIIPSNDTDANHTAMATRLYRQIETSTGFLVFVDEVLSPVPVKMIFQNYTLISPDVNIIPTVQPNMFPDTNGRHERDTEHPEISAEAPSGQNFFGFSNQRGNNHSSQCVIPTIPAIPPFYSFSSTTNLVATRNDLSIFSALINYVSRARAIIEEESRFRSLHILAPNNNAFMKIGASIFGIRKNSSEEEARASSKIERVLMEIVGNSTRIEQFVHRLDQLWKNISSLPPLQDVLLYHVLNSSMPLKSFPNNASVETLSNNIRRPGLNVSEAEIVDEDRGRVSAKPIASFATLNGYVTVIDSFLTSFDLRIALSVISAALDESPAGGEELKQKEQSSFWHPNCFPGDAAVMLKDGKWSYMEVLKAGDEVHTGDERVVTSKIFAFSHREEEVFTDMVRIQFANFTRSVTLSYGHYVYVNGKLSAAGAVRRGDILKYYDGRVYTVNSVVHSEQKMGLYAPHSFHGDLVINGVVVSTYSTSVHPTLAHLLFAPVRAFARIFGVVEPLGSLLYEGGGFLARLLPIGPLRYD